VTVRDLLKFQSTPLHEGRLMYAQALLADHYVSIHAPARGATRVCCPACDRDMFQSTPLHEGRLQKSKALKLLRISSEIRAPSERTDDFVCLPFYEIHLSK